MGTRKYFLTCLSYIYGKTGIRRHQNFLGGPRTKMKKSSENFWRASGAQKKGFPNFSPAAAFFRYRGTEKPLKIVKFSKNVNFLKKGPQNFFSKNWSVDIMKEGGQNILFPPPHLSITYVETPFELIALK